MLSNFFLLTNQSDLKKLGDKLNYEAKFSLNFINSEKQAENIRKWFSQVRSVSIYGTFLIKNLLDSLKKYQDKSEEQIGYYIGKIAIQPFLELINAYELSTNQLIEDNEYFSSLLDRRIVEKTEIIENNWNSDCSRKERKIKAQLIKSFQRKKTEMKFVRDTLLMEKIIDNLDMKILDFCWDIRNSMHNNFSAIKDIQFSAPGTSINCTFNFKKGQELHHSGSLLNFYFMTEQMIYIQHKIISHLNKQN